MAKTEEGEKRMKSIFKREKTQTKLESINPGKWSKKIIRCLSFAVGIEVDTGDSDGE